MNSPTARKIPDAVSALTDSRPARIGIIGAGYWAVEFYLPFLEAQPDAVCVGVVGRGAGKLEALQRRFGLEVATEHVDTLLAAGCDGVIIASPNPLHREHAVAALAAGAQVLIEKPMTVLSTDAVVLEELSGANDRRLSVAHGWNYNPLTVWASGIMDQGLLGAVSSVNLSMSSSLLGLFSGQQGYGRIEIEGCVFEASPETWTDPTQGGGYAYGQLSHGLGIALSLVSDEPTEVFARMSTLQNGVDADTAISVSFEGGALGSFFGHGRLPDGTRKGMSIGVTGEFGELRLDYERERADLVVTAERREWMRDRSIELAPLSIKEGLGLYDNIGPTRHLIDVCHGAPSVNRAPAALGRRCVNVLEAAVVSARSCFPVAINEGRVMTHGSE